jgi:hypothetical protein
MRPSAAHPAPPRGGPGGLRDTCTVLSHPAESTMLSSSDENLTFGGGQGKSIRRTGAGGSARFGRRDVARRRALHGCAGGRQGADRKHAVRVSRARMAVAACERRLPR